MNEEDTTSSSRIFVKIFMQEMMEEMGMGKLVERFKVADLRPAFAAMFPMDNPKNTRFAINYFTSIGLGKVTEDMRTYLQNAPKLLAAQHAAMKAAESSDSDSDSTDSSDLTSSESESETESDVSSRHSRPKRRRYSDSRSPRRETPPRKRYDDRRNSPRRR